jgi:hypothetical protein
MYDNLMSGVYSILEINVGIICVSMPAFRRILAILVPKCFGSTQNDSKPKFSDDAMPNARYPSKPTRRRKSNMNSSLFNTTITKTVDMNMESNAMDDDEVRLVELQKNGMKTTTQSLGESTMDNDRPRDQKSFYRG